MLPRHEHRRTRTGGRPGLRADHPPAAQGAARSDTPQAPPRGRHRRAAVAQPPAGRESPPIEHPSPRGWPRRVGSLPRSDARFARLTSPHSADPLARPPVRGPRCHPLSGDAPGRTGAVGAREGRLGKSSHEKPAGPVPSTQQWLQPTRPPWRRRRRPAPWAPAAKSGRADQSGTAIHDCRFEWRVPNARICRRPGFRSLTEHAAAFDGDRRFIGRSDTVTRRPIMRGRSARRRRALKRGADAAVSPSR